MSLFASKTNSTAAAHAGRGEPSIFEAPDKIAHLLKQLLDEHQLFSVTLLTADGPLKASSALIKIDTVQALIYLDELTPQAANTVLSRLKSCRVDGFLKGVPITFSSTWVGAGKQDELPFHGLRFPSMVRYDQRRAFFRVAVPLLPRVIVQLHTKDGPNLAARLRDISLGGIKAELEKVPSTLFHPGDKIPAIVIPLPEKKFLRTALEVRSFKRNRQDANLMLGARFVGMKPADNRMVQAYIAKLEREKLKTR